MLFPAFGHALLYRIAGPLAGPKNHAWEAKINRFVEVSEQRVVLP